MESFAPLGITSTNPFIVEEKMKLEQKFMLHTLVVVMTIILSLLIIINLFLRVYYPEWMPLPMLDDVPEYVYLIIGIIAGFSAGRALKLYKKLKHENHYV